MTLGEWRYLPNGEWATNVSPSFVNALQTGSFGIWGAFQESSSATSPTD
jgi:hypothetical protein